MLYGTHSVPLRRHLAHFDSPSTGSHLILCLLHSAPVVESVQSLGVDTGRPLTGSDPGRALLGVGTLPILMIDVLTRSLLLRHL